jgi:hypothetical protein
MLGRKKIIVSRYSGEFVNGRWVRATHPTLISIRASIQSVSELEMQSLDEGRRNSTVLKLITDTQLYAAEAGSRNSDIVTLYGNEVYEVIGISRWQNGIISHYEVLIGKATQ